MRKMNARVNYFYIERDLHVISPSDSIQPTTSPSRPAKPTAEAPGPPISDAIEGPSFSRGSYPAVNPGPAPPRAAHAAAGGRFSPQLPPGAAPQGSSCTTRVSRPLAAAKAGSQLANAGDRRPGGPWGVLRGPCESWSRPRRRGARTHPKTRRAEIRFEAPVSPGVAPRGDRLHHALPTSPRSWAGINAGDILDHVGG